MAYLGFLLATNLRNAASMARMQRKNASRPSTSNSSQYARISATVMAPAPLKPSGRDSLNWKNASKTSTFSGQSSG